MGFWDQLWDDIVSNAKDIASNTRELGERALCFTGLHSGEWEYLSQGSCKQEYVCQRLHCDHVDTRTSHEGWSSWSYLNPKSCLKERICTRCNHREEKKEHQSWTDWQYIEMDDCEQTKNCERCEEADYRTKHTYESKWDYTNANDCTVHVLCSRCRDKKILPDKEHKWVTIKHPTIPNQYRNYCQRCKAMEDVDNS